jgi:two-component system, LytTR family, response regulator
MRDLPKSITPDQLQAVPQRFVPTPKISKPAAQELTGTQRVLIQEGKHCWMVRVADLMLLESDGNYTRVHFGMSHPMIARSLNYMQKRLDPTIFFRANRHTIINFRCVKCIEPSAKGGFWVRLDSGYEIEISRRQGQLLKKQMTL